MPVTKAQKEEILADLKDKFSRSKSVVFAANKGLSVLDISDFRNKLREGNAEYKIGKKTLIKLAAKETNQPEITDDVMEGPVGAVFSFDDELFPAQVAYKFAKTNKHLEIKGGIFFGEIIAADKIAELANIPSKEELLAKLVGCIQAPLANFVGIGNSIISSFVRACAEVGKQKN